MHELLLKGGGWNDLNKGLCKDDYKTFMIIIVIIELRIITRRKMIIFMIIIDRPYKKHDMNSLTVSLFCGHQTTKSFA